VEEWTQWFWEQTIENLVWILFQFAVFLVTRLWSAAINARRVVILSNVDLVRRSSCKLVDAENQKERLNAQRPQVTMKKREYLCVIESARS